MKPVLGLAGPNPATRSLCGLNIARGVHVKCLNNRLPYNLLLNIPRQIYLDSNLPILSTKRIVWSSKHSSFIAGYAVVTIIRRVVIKTVLHSILS